MLERYYNIKTKNQCEFWLGNWGVDMDIYHIPVLMHINLTNNFCEPTFKVDRNIKRNAKNYFGCIHNDTRESTQPSISIVRFRNC